LTYRQPQGALGLGRTKAYELAKAGEFPCRVIRAGRRYHVPTAEILRLVGLSTDEASRAEVKP
jgi:predicted DNA-binding transcriptional regulator AlpA